MLGSWGSGRWRSHAPKALVEHCKVWEAGKHASNTASCTFLYFGGRRCWLQCPECGGRVGKLYLPPGRCSWACRRCHGLAYASQREIPAYRAIRRAQKIRGRLGGSINLYLPFPERPRGMHWRKYFALRNIDEALSLRVRAHMESED